ncbi:MAG: prepilin-type N-terminal cleavage/methylation domain-containing protein [bacterium]|nr:prepilin-type N-terminal cleavage/methylation domain-containing protein [bacterium]
MTPLAPRRCSLRTAGRKTGFTLVEIVIAMTILTLVVINISMVTEGGSRAARAGAFHSKLEDEADLTLDRISLALMSSSAASVYPQTPAPAYTSEVNYSISLGVGAGGEMISGDLERIQWTRKPGVPGRVMWIENPGLANERHVVWSNWVPAVYQDEILNGNDDNGNGIADETGLAFDIDGPEVNIHLTVERLDPNGVPTPTQRRVNVTCRN